MKIPSLSPYAKAVVAFIVPGASSLMVAMQDSSAGGSVITGNEWLTAALVCIVTSGTVWAARNVPSVPGSDYTPKHS